MLGQPPKQSVLSRHVWLEMIHPDDRDQATRCIEGHLSGQHDLLECEYRVRHADGRWIRIACRGRVVERDAQSHPIRSVGVARDVTAQREWRQALMARELRPEND